MYICQNVEIKRVPRLSSFYLQVYFLLCLFRVENHLEIVSVIVFSTVQLCSVQFNCVQYCTVPASVLRVPAPMCALWSTQGCDTRLFGTTSICRCDRYKIQHHHKKTTILAQFYDKQNLHKMANHCRRPIFSLGIPI